MSEERPPDAGREPRRGGERRAYPRHEVTGVRGSFLFTTGARVVNLSADGLALESSHALRVGRTYRLQLAHGERDLDLEGTVVWCSLVRTRGGERGEVQPVYHAGVRFDELLGARADGLADFIKGHAVVSLEKRLSGRFRLRSGGAAAVDHRARFEVHKLSRSGMLIEADVVPDPDGTLEVEMRLASGLFTGQARIVHVRRLETQEGASRAEIGLEFGELDEGPAAALAAFLDDQPD